MVQELQLINGIKNTIDNNTSGTLISGATSSTFLPPTNTVGTTYYYVVISFTTGGCSEIVSDTAAIEVADLSQIDIDIVTIGQYLRPTSKHRPIHRYVTQDEFIEYKLIGEKFGIPHIESGPLVRSSYHAKDSFASV